MHIDQIARANCDTVTLRRHIFRNGQNSIDSNDMKHHPAVGRHRAHTAANHFIRQSCTNLPADTRNASWSRRAIIANNYLLFTKQQKNSTLFDIRYHEIVHATEPKRRRQSDIPSTLSCVRGDRLRTSPSKMYLKIVWFGVSVTVKELFVVCKIILPQFSPIVL